MKNKFIVISLIFMLLLSIFTFNNNVYASNEDNFYTEKGIMAKISDKINVEYQKIFNNYNNLFI